MHVSIYLFIYLSTSIPTLSIHLQLLYISIHLSIHVSNLFYTCLPTCPSLYLSIYLIIHKSIYLLHCIIFNYLAVIVFLSESKSISHLVSQSTHALFTLTWRRQNQLLLHFAFSCQRTPSFPVAPLRQLYEFPFI